MDVTQEDQTAYIELRGVKTIEDVKQLIKFIAG